MNSARRQNRQLGWIKIAVLIMAGVLIFIAGALLLWGTSWRVPILASEYRYEFFTEWDGSGFPTGAFEHPIGIAVAPTGDVYVSDARKRVVHLSFGGEYIGEWGSEGSEPGQFINPIGIAAAPNGSVFVSDYDLDRVQKFSPEGEFLLEFGSSGTEFGRFDAAAGLVAGTDFVYVADFYNHRVQKFGTDGSFQQTIGHSGRLGDGALHYPTDVDLTPQGHLLVADAYNYQLQWFQPEGRPLQRTGSHILWLWPSPSSSISGFNAPSGVAAGSDGLIHLADSGNHRVVMLSNTGEYMTHWALPEPNPNVYSPEHMAVSPDGQTVYATDLSANRIVVLKVLH